MDPLRYPKTMDGSLIPKQHMPICRVNHANKEEKINTNEVELLLGQIKYQKEIIKTKKAELVKKQDYAEEAKQILKEELAAERKSQLQETPPAENEAQLPIIPPTQVTIPIAELHEIKKSLLALRERLAHSK